MCMQVAWGLGESASSDSAGLGGGGEGQDSASPSEDPGDANAPGSWPVQEGL